MRAMLFPLVLAFMLPVTVSADDRTHDVTPEDYVTLAGITEVALSPDGKHVAYCEGRWDKSDDSRKTDLWVVTVDGKSKPMRLTGEMGALRVTVESESQQFTSVSNVLKTRHDTAMNSIRNMK